MPAVKHTLLLVLSVILTYLWLSTPALSNYSIQAFSVASLGYFAMKKLNNGKLWHILPKNYSLEMMFVTFAILILVGSTGNTSSVFYPFTFIHLFILVMSFKEKTAIIVAMSTVLFHYAIETPASSGDIATLMTVPMMLIFFLFAKRQYDDAKISHLLIEKEEKQIESLTDHEQTLESFIGTFLKPKLLTIIERLNNSAGKKQQVVVDALSEVSLLIDESNKILEKVKKTDNIIETSNQVELSDQNEKSSL